MEKPRDSKLYFIRLYFMRPRPRPTRTHKVETKTHKVETKTHKVEAETKTYEKVAYER